MEYTISLHAQQRIIRRRISADVLDDVIHKPDNKVVDGECIRIYQKKFKEIEKVYLYRVYLNICKDPAFVITAYRTSKIEKYDY